jgi:hypothetical protein
MILGTKIALRTLPILSWWNLVAEKNLDPDT